MAEKTNSHLQLFYSSSASILADSRVLTAVSIFLQCTTEALVEALMLRDTDSHIHEGRTIMQGYYHYPKLDKKKSRYITEPLPVLREIQERILFMLQSLGGRNEQIFEELTLYGSNNGYKIDNLIMQPTTAEGLGFYETPEQKTRLHTRFSSNPYFIHIDVEKAFPSASEKRIYEKLSEMFSGLRLLPPLTSLSEREYQKAMAILAHMLSYDNHLATGSPASPFTFHLLLASTNQKIIKTLETAPLAGVTVTTYLDDIIATFSRIETPTVATITQIREALAEMCKHIFDDTQAETKTHEAFLFKPEIQVLPLIIGKLSTFLDQDQIVYSDNSAKKTLKEDLHYIRVILVIFKEIFLELERKLIAVNTQDAEKIIDSLFTLIRNLASRLSKNIYNVIGSLDMYKKRLDNSQPNYPITLDSISNELADILVGDGRQVNKQKFDIRYPDSPSIKSMLGLGIAHGGLITIPRKHIKAKIEFYKRILADKSTAPRYLRHKDTGELDYRKIFESIQGYKKYLLTIKHVNNKDELTANLLRTMKKGFTKKDREEFKKLEIACVACCNISLDEAYKQFYKTKNIPMENRDEKDAPIDERDIPWEDAESNKKPKEPNDDLPF